MTLDDLLTLPLPQRVAWLHSVEGPQGKLSHDRFAAALGVPNRQTIIGWEGGTEPSVENAEKLATFSGFPAWAFRRRESEEAASESFARRLRELEEQQDEMRGLVFQAFEVIRALESQVAEARAAEPRSPAKRRKSA